MITRRLLVMTLGFMVLAILSLLFIDWHRTGSDPFLPKTVSYQDKMSEVSPSNISDQYRVRIGEADFFVEIADTPGLISKGLSGRISMPEHAGMLFVFPEEDIRTFWMKGMLFPLDLIWINESCNVVDITHGARLPDEDIEGSELVLYKPRTAARYTLEVNAGTAVRTAVSIGDEVVFEGLFTNGVCTLK